MLTRFNKIIRISYLLDQFVDPRDVNMAVNIENYLRRNQKERDENSQKMIDMYLKPLNRTTTIQAHLNTLELKTVHEEFTKVHPEHAEKFLSFAGQPPRRLIIKLQELKQIGLIVDFTIGSSEIDREAHYVDFRAK